MKRLYTIVMLALLLAGFAFYEYMDNKEKTNQLTIIASEQLASIDTAAEAGQELDASPTAFKPKPGEQTFEVFLPNMEEKDVAFGGEEKGKLQLINFWASWCGPCELEAPDLQQIHQKYKEHLVLYGVNATDTDKERQAREFVEQYGFTFEVLFDRTGDITRMYKISSLPTSFLVDENGVILERINGVITLEQWENMIDAYIKQL